MSTATCGGKLVCIAAYIEADKKVNISINLCANMLKVSAVPDFNLTQRLWQTKSEFMLMLEHLEKCVFVVCLLTFW